MTTRIIIADDHALFRQGLKSVLMLEPDVKIVAEVERVDDLLPTLARTPCDLLLLDLQMDRNALSEIGGLAAQVKVMVVTASERASDALSAVQAGARAVVFKRFAIETLMEAIQAVEEGFVWMPPSLQAEVRSHAFERDNGRLSLREREIARLVAFGLRNAEIAKQLLISEATVKTHLNKAFQKLSIRDRVELARYAIRIGLVDVNEPMP